MGAITDRYYFIHTVKKVFDFTTGRGFFMNDFMYDKQDNALYKAKVLNSDFVKKRGVDMFCAQSIIMKSRLFRHWQPVSWSKFIKKMDCKAG